MNKYFCLLFILLLLAYGCVVKKDYKCPDNLSRLQYLDSTNTYVEWISCKPPAPCDTIGMEKYEKWVNKNCNIKYEVKIAW